MPMGVTRRWTPLEDEILRDMFWQGKTDTVIAEKLNTLQFASLDPRSYRGVEGRRKLLGLMHSPSKEWSSLPRDHEFRCKWGDRKFKLAMIRAVRNGEEIAIFGVMKDRSPIPSSAMRFDQERSMPVTQSSLATCQEY